MYIQIIKTYIQTYSKVSWDWNGYKISGEMIVYEVNFTWFTYWLDAINLQPLVLVTWVLIALEEASGA